MPDHYQLLVGAFADRILLQYLDDNAKSEQTPSGLGAIAKDGKPGRKGALEPIYRTMGGTKGTICLRGRGMEKDLTEAQNGWNHEKDLQPLPWEVGLQGYHLGTSRRSNHPVRKEQRQELELR
jgi:hypothetical protein